MLSLALLAKPLSLLGYRAWGGLRVGRAKPRGMYRPSSLTSKRQPLNCSREAATAHTDLGISGGSKHQMLVSEGTKG